MRRWLARVSSMSSSCLVAPSHELLMSLEQSAVRPLWRDYRAELARYGLRDPAVDRRGERYCPSSLGQLRAYPVRCRCGLLLPFDYYFSADCGSCMTCRKVVVPPHILDAVRVAVSLEVGVARTWEILVGYFGYPRRF